MSRNLVTDKDLQEGLYFFGCTRAHAMDPTLGDYEAGKRIPKNELTWEWQDDPAEGKRQHQRLMNAVAYAEQHGRVLWRNDGPNERGEDQVNGLLTRNGYQPISFREPSHASYAEMEEAINASNQGIQVMFKI